MLDAAMQNFQPEVVCEKFFRVEVPWAFIGGRHFPVVESLFKSGVIERQAWRVANYTHYCIFYFREESDAEKFIKAIGGYHISG